MNQPAMMRDLIEQGWIPPAPEYLEPYREALIAYFRARDCPAIAKGLRDGDSVEPYRRDVQILVAAQPFMPPLVSPGSEATPPASESSEGEGADSLSAPSPEWEPVLRGFIAEHDNFTTAEAIEATGLDGSDSSYRAITHMLIKWSLRSTVDSHSNTRRWSKREAA